MASLNVPLHARVLVRAPASGVSGNGLGLLCGGGAGGDVEGGSKTNAGCGEAR